MSVIFYLLWPETLLIVVGCLLFLVGMSQNPGVRRLAPISALASLVAVFVIVLWSGGTQSQEPLHDQWNTVTIFHFQEYVKLIAAGVGVLLVLLAWPSNPDATGNPGVQYGHECGEFFGLMLLSIAGIFMVASANDLILLFLGIELASIPTYILVSISRPVPVAQEAGVKYFFLGAMAAALLLFGFSYLYGTTGQTNLDRIGAAMHLTTPGHEWQLFAVIVTLIGLSFKIAAVPLHNYAGDVYTGAATPLTAFLGFVPKTSGFVAIIKILYTVSQYGDSHWVVPDTIAKLLWVLSVLTMFMGNVLAFGSLQHNVKRVLAYSSVAHSGYMLAGVTVLVTATGQPLVQEAALGGVLFYLAAYGLMNTGAFGVLTMLPARYHVLHGYLEPSEGPAVEAATGTSAETFEDIAGQGRKHLFLGLCMAAFCWSLTGLPLTVGFFAKFFLIRPMFQAARGEVTGRMVWLVVFVVINAAISAAYYLRIIGTMFLRPEHGVAHAAHGPHPPAENPLVLRGPTPWPVAVGVALCVMGTIAFGVSFRATGSLAQRAQTAWIHAPQAAPAPTVASTR